MELTEEHFKRLEEAEVDFFLEELRKSMLQLDLLTAFPQDKQEYKRFLLLAYKKSLKYGLETKKDAYAFIITWHVLGKQMVQSKWLMDIIKSKENYTWEKREALLCACYEKIDEVEGN